MTEIILNISLNELCQLEGIENTVIVKIVEYGIAEPIVGNDTANWVFDATSVHWIKKAVRLYQDLEIDWIAVAIIIDLMQKKETLEKENKLYKQQLRRFLE